MLAFCWIFGLAMAYYVLVVVNSTYRCTQIQATPTPTSPPFVSVLIPARNEAANLKVYLPQILCQSYKHYEVIAIDDHSEDETLQVLADFQLRFSHLKVISLTEIQNSQKKLAITQGVLQAKGEIILQTDADCKVEANWVAAVVRFFDEKTGLVSGPVALTAPNNTTIELLQCLEFAGLNILGGGSIARNQPNMCNGANLAYRKSVYEAVKGFEGIDGVASGDDELLLQKINLAEKWKIRYAYDASAIVRTPAQPTLAHLLPQRLRWVSKSRHYLDKRINLTQLLFFVALNGIWIMALLGNWKCALLLLGAKVLADLYLTYESLRFFNLSRLWKLLPLFEVVYLPYVFYIGIKGNFVKTYQWKGRTVQ